MKGPIWIVAVAMALGVWVGVEMTHLFWVATSLLLISWAAVAWGLGRFGLVGLGFSLGLWVLCLQEEGPLFEGDVAIQGWVASPPAGREADVSVVRWRVIGGHWTSTTGRVRVRFCEKAPSLGSAVSVMGYSQPIHRQALPGAPDPMQAMYRARVRTSMSCRYQVTPPVPPPVLSLKKGSNVGILIALSTGQRDHVSKETWSLLRRTGTAHLLAISGFHIGLVAWFAFVIGRVVFRILAVGSPRGASERWVLVFSVCAAWCYASGAGLPVSAQRAAMMVTLVALAKGFSREIPAGNLLGLAGMAVLAFDPSSIASPGFQLSFMAVIGLIRVTPWVDAFLGSPRGWVGWLTKGLSATVGATVGTLPVAGWWFQEIAFWSPIANIIALPWVAWAVVPCAFGAVWLPEPFSGLFLWLGDEAMNGLVGVLTLLDTSPIIVALSPFSCGVGVVLCLLPRRWSLIALFVAQLSLDRVVNGLTLTLLDVGHGEAILVEWPNRQTWLIDGGPPGRHVLQYLRRRGVGRLDVVVLTHGHRDHAGGLWAVVEQMEIGSIWFGSSWDERIVSRAAERGIPIVLDPEGALQTLEGSDNERSLVLPIHWGEFSALLTGDMGFEAENSLHSRIPNNVDVLKVAHHGSRYSSSESFLDVVQPRIALISASGSYGLPHAETLDRYRARGVQVLRTDTLGTIQLSLRSDGIQGWHYRAGEGWSFLPLNMP